MNDYGVMLVLIMLLELLGLLIVIWETCGVIRILEMNPVTLYTCSCYRITEKIMLTSYML